MRSSQKNKRITVAITQSPAIISARNNNETFVAAEKKTFTYANGFIRILFHCVKASTS